MLDYYKMISNFMIQILDRAGSRIANLLMNLKA